MKIETNKPRRHTTDVIILAVLFIISGLAIFAHNRGVLDNHIYDILISWQMLLVVLGIWALIRKHWYNAVIFIGLGSFFLIPVVFDAGAGWAGVYWPLLLIIVGLLIITGIFDSRAHKSDWERFSSDNTSYDSQDGYVVSDVRMGNIEHVVLDPVFRGAKIRSLLGGTVLDLRHTTIEQGDTYIDLECRFSGVELYVPQEWVVVNNLQPSMAGVDDKRFRGRNADSTRRLILRGTLSLSGVSVKS